MHLRLLNEVSVILLEMDYFLNKNICISFIRNVDEYIE